MVWEWVGQLLVFANSRLPTSVPADAVNANDAACLSRVCSSGHDAADDGDADGNGANGRSDDADEQGKGKTEYADIRNAKLLFKRHDQCDLIQWPVLHPFSFLLVQN
jgi:hypothetical protein